MKILYFYQYFATSKGSWGTRVYEFAREWQKGGHQVTVISSIYAKSDIKAQSLIEHQWHDSIHVIVINVKIDNKQSFFRRIYSFILYALISSWYALIYQYDLAIASSGPISVGIPGLIAKHIRRKRLVFEVRDMWPQGAIEMGIIKNRIIQKLAYLLEKICYKSSNLIVSLSPGMKTEIEKKNILLPKVISIPNSANLDLFSREVPVPDLQLHNLEKNRYAIYAGNIGKVNNVEWMFEAARILSLKRSSIKILLIGDGQLKENLMQRSEHEKLNNIIFLPLIPKYELIGYLQNALLSLVPLSDKPILATSSPNKFYESLAAGVPVVQTTSGWMKDFVDEHNVGFTINPNDPNQLADLLLQFEMGNSQLFGYNERCKVIAAAYFDKEKLAKEMIIEIEKVYAQKD